MVEAIAVATYKTKINCWENSKYLLHTNYVDRQKGSLLFPVEYSNHTVHSLISQTRHTTAFLISTEKMHLLSVHTFCVCFPSFQHISFGCNCISIQYSLPGERTCLRNINKYVAFKYRTPNLSNNSFDIWHSCESCRMKRTESYTVHERACFFTLKTWFKVNVKGLKKSQISKYLLISINHCPLQSTSQDEAIQHAGTYAIKTWLLK